MDFTLKDVTDGFTRVYLSGARNRFETDQDDSEFIWNDELWPYVDHFRIKFVGENRWTVCEVVYEEAFFRTSEKGVSAEEVVTLIHKLSDGFYSDVIVHF